MKESDLIKRFVKGLEDYPFATHIEREVPVSGGRVDIRLPDYDVVIEAKGPDGSTKKAIGQALWYAEELGDIPYILLPPDSITNTTTSVCEDCGIGILTASRVPRMVLDVGGLETFNMYDFKGSFKRDPMPEGDTARKEIVAGPSQETIDVMRESE